MRYLLPVLFATLSLSAAQADEPVAQIGPELREVSSFKLDMDFVKRLGAATTEVLAYEEGHPDDAPKIEGYVDDDTDTLDRRVMRIGKLAPVMSVLKKYKLTPNQYVVGGLAVMQARGGAQMVKIRGKDAWDDLKARGINTDNVRFFMINQQEIDALMGTSS
jgi:hypothetical protein